MTKDLATVISQILYKHPDIVFLISDITVAGLCENFSYSACMHVQYVFKLHGKTVSLDTKYIMLNAEKQWCEVTLPMTVPDRQDMKWHICGV